MFKVSVESETNPTLVMKKLKPEIKSLSDWEKGFMIYMAVYIQKPDLAADLPDMFTYWWEVRSISEQGGDFILYDSEFR